MGGGVVCSRVLLESLVFLVFLVFPRVSATLCGFALGIFGLAGWLAAGWVAAWLAGWLAAGWLAGWLAKENGPLSKN